MTPLFFQHKLYSDLKILLFGDQKFPKPQRAFRQLSTYPELVNQTKLSNQTITDLNTNKQEISAVIEEFNAEMDCI